MDIERGNTKHGPAHDEELADELDKALRGTGRVEDWREPEPLSGDDAETDIRSDYSKRAFPDPAAPQSRGAVPDGDDRTAAPLIGTGGLADLPNAVVAAVFRTAASVRHARVFHPRGIRLAGRFRPARKYEPWFGAGDRAVIARLSKGFGSPVGVPDVLGLAFRVLDRDDHPWDFALATTGRGTLGRFVFTPARSWSTACFGSLLPYRFADAAPAWLFAEPLDAEALPNTASLQAIGDYVDDQVIRYTLTADGLGGPAETIGELDLRRAEPGEHRTDFFDPVLNHPAEVALVPDVVNRLRESAYLGSRRGRDDEGSQPRT
ncbi:phosphodiesterase [Nocardia sp. MW-W600-9]